MDLKFYDTNALLVLQDKILSEYFYISSVTLQELENIKVSRNKDDEIKYKARKLLHILDEHENEYGVVIFDEIIGSYITNAGLEMDNDNKIIACACSIKNDYDDFVFVTNDLCCKSIAHYICKLNVESVSSRKDSIYKGYKEISGNTEVINEIMANIDYSEWNVNEYLIINNTDDGSVKEMRYDGSKFVALKLPSSKFIKGKNSLQRCALDALMNPDITICAILGGYGSGKTFLAMQMALYSVQEKGTQSKILGIRETRGEGKEVGFLPGTLDDKTENFFLPLVQQLNGGEFELESLKQRGILESNIPFYLKGTTYNETVIICDEAEDLTESQIKLVGTRLGQNSKIYFSGDYKQSVLNKTTDNALIKMCNELKGDKHFACVCLNEDVRSETSKLFADLFE